jgi:hypothetical protein
MDIDCQKLLNNLIQYLGEIDQGYTDKKAVSFHKLGHYIPSSQTRFRFKDTVADLMLWLWIKYKAQTITPASLTVTKL